MIHCYEEVDKQDMADQNNMKIKIKVEGEDDGADNECYVQYWYNTESNCNVKHEMKVESRTISESRHKDANFDCRDEIAVPGKAKEANISDCQSFERAACSTSVPGKITLTEEITSPSVETLRRRCHVVLERTDRKTEAGPAPNLSTQNETKTEWEYDDDEVQFVEWRIKSEEVDLPDAEFPADTRDSRNETEPTQKIEKPIGSSSKSFQCAACSTNFYSKKTLAEHISNHCFKGVFPLCVIEKQFKCELCQKLCSSRYQFKTHKISHSGIKPFTCEVCNRGFMDKSNMKKHAILHTGEKPFACNICQQRYADKSDLNTHMRWHSGIKPHACKLCKRRFFTTSELKSHERIHARKKANLCEICGQSFTEVATLKLHLSSHSNETPFECKLCDKKFKARAYLRRHKVRHSEVEETATCHVCQEIYTKRDLSSHMRIHSGLNILRCQECKMKFFTEEQLEKHMTRHPSVKPFACGICPMRYAVKHRLRGHIHRHLGLKPFECVYCDLKYETRWRLRDHVDKTHVVEKLMTSLP